MWLMTKHGFYSIVRKAPDEFQVRSREVRDLQNLIERIPLPQQKVVETPKADYAARLIVNRDVLLKILAFLGETIDYQNFKDRISTTPDQTHKPYHQVWSVMAEALGAYGTKGNRQRKS
jgi:hypothetical protein